MKNLLLRVLMILSVLVVSSSFASAEDMCKSLDLQIGDEVNIYASIKGETKKFYHYTVTDRREDPTGQVDDLVIITGYQPNFPKRKLFEHVFCQKNTLILTFFASLENGIRKTHNKKEISRYTNGVWVFKDTPKDMHAWAEITKKTSLASK